VNFNHSNCEIISTGSIPGTPVSGIVTAEHQLEEAESKKINIININKAFETPSNCPLPIKEDFEKNLKEPKTT
jgi:hypothetical protein